MSATTCASCPPATWRRTSWKACSTWSCPVSREDLEHPSHAVTKVADALPGFGIVAAVLGIVITMALLGEGSQAEIGHRRRRPGGHLPRDSRRLRLRRPAGGRPGARCQGRVEPVRGDQGLPGRFRFRHAAFAAVEFGRKVLLPIGRPSPSSSRPCAPLSGGTVDRWTITSRSSSSASSAMPPATTAARGRSPSPTSPRR